MLYWKLWGSNNQNRFDYHTGACIESSECMFECVALYVSELKCVSEWMCLRVHHVILVIAKIAYKSRTQNNKTLYEFFVSFYFFPFTPSLLCQPARHWLPILAHSSWIFYIHIRTCEMRVYSNTLTTNEYAVCAEMCYCCCWCFWWIW